ncbi:DUF2975 domain-containing protein [Nonlabens sp.]|uniref:DUF2975 domain-containing protein n=1 Tax=Nonlabens sp. TaxID=1888209 RepID=UPI003F6A0628
MKSLQVLRAVLGFVYFFGWMAAIGSPILFIDPVIHRGIQLSGYTVYNIHWSFYLVAGAVVIGYFFFVAMIYYLRKVAWSIKPKKLFQDDLAPYFRKAGWSCIIGIIITKIPVVIYFYSVQINHPDTVVTRNGLSPGLSYDSFFVITAFGLFLLIMGKITQNARELQKENDLTI